MTQGTALSLANSSLLMVMLVGGPVLALGLLVGLAVSIFQATTQINEQTLAFVPKFLAMIVAILFFGPFMLREMVDFTSGLLGNLSAYLH